ncbi:MAG: AbrB/MazE/SpoVT family DNA-binding domain-containing protein [Hydrococcus sp. C42_A2020_068]|nr:AbrB/MazE/SpoVT family DNA-binding domain-containing protein [Hydrococcus sp. C42_A2020_068]
MQLKIRKIGNSYGVIFPSEMISRLKVAEGDSVYVTESAEGYNISAFDPDFAETMAAFEETYRQYRNAFKELAK